MIDITGCDIPTLIKAVYDLSEAKDMGILHYTPGPISEEDLKFVSDHHAETGQVRMDYVAGRCCKFNTHTTEGKLTIGDSWYDHTDAQLDDLLSRIGFSRTQPAESHGGCCECDTCKESRAETKSA